MSNYSHALISINLAKDSHEEIIEKAVSLVDQSKCRVSLAYVLKPLAFSYDRGLTLGLIDRGLENLQSEAETHTKDKMKELADKYNIPHDRVHTLTGKPDSEIIKLTKKLNCDLLFLGNNHSGKLLDHTRTGWLTRNSVLSDVGCDILLVSVGG